MQIHWHANAALTAYDYILDQEKIQEAALSYVREHPRATNFNVPIGRWKVSATVKRDDLGPLLVLQWIEPAGVHGG
ncbi:MAG: hypothetical protein K2Q20_00425 [Phycisphaerales bacterium]|nr:hypothetical protein [Phycisphaerales bacterium]